VNTERMRASVDRPLASRRARAWLASGYLVMAALTSLTPLLPGRWSAGGLLAGLVVLALLWFALRRATRLWVDAPDDVLDELLVRLRNAVFVEAYRVLAAVTVVVGVGLATLAPLLADGSATGRPGVTAAGLWLLVALALGLPLVVAAYRLPPADDEAS
jgi:hypothetical protein